VKNHARPLKWIIDRFRKEKRARRTQIADRLGCPARHESRYSGRALEHRIPNAVWTNSLALDHEEWQKKKEIGRAPKEFFSIRFRRAVVPEVCKKNRREQLAAGF